LVKVLHAISSRIIGGTEIATRRVADAVRPFGVQSAALLLRPSGELMEFFERAGIPCLADFPRPEPSLVREAWPFLRASSALARLFAKFDIVHCADTVAANKVAVAGRLARRPVLCHVRNRQTALWWRDRLTIGASDHFAFVSRDTREHFAISLPERRASVVYDGVNIPPPCTIDERKAVAAGVRAEFDQPQDAVLVAMFARLNPQKDYETLMRAAATLRSTHPKIRFLIVGDTTLLPKHSEHFQRVQNFGRALGVLDRFIFAGFREDTARLMLAADICVLCTHFEGLPLAVLEAMAAGRPCIATAVDGVPEALTDGETGLLHRHEDAAQLAACIARLADERDMAEAMGANARADAERRFSRGRCARDIYDLYSRLLRARGAEQPVRGEQITAEANF
jgi:glycosyltransferase involved in cell wall biosynthesis